jgi:hypothetical protein
MDIMFEEERGDERRELDVEISESERFRFRTIDAAWEARRRDRGLRIELRGITINCGWQTSREKALGHENGRGWRTRSARTTLVEKTR